MTHTFRRTEFLRPMGVTTRRRPTGTTAAILDLIGYGKGPKHPRNAALAAS